MARPRSNGTLTIAQLERMLDNRRREAAELQRERSKLMQRLDALDRKLGALAGAGARFRNGAGGGGGGGRSRNPKSLVATMEAVLSRSGKPMSVGDIMEAVRAEGYRSSSANFRGIINQTLIKEKRFTSAGRGIYQLKK
jgi:hypothetical protein